MPPIHWVPFSLSRQYLRPRKITASLLTLTYNHDEIIISGMSTNSERAPLYQGERFNVLRIEVGHESHESTYRTKAIIKAIIWDKVKAAEREIPLGLLKNTFLGVTGGWYRAFEAYTSPNPCPDQDHLWERIQENFHRVDEAVDICLCPKCLSSKGIRSGRQRY